MKLLSKDNETISTQRLVEQVETIGSSSKAEETGKKEFVEPELSVPVNVLEATTFFQGTDSGGSGQPN